MLEKTEKGEVDKILEAMRKFFPYAFGNWYRIDGLMTHKHRYKRVTDEQAIEMLQGLLSRQKQEVAELRANIRQLSEFLSSLGHRQD